MGGRRKPCLCDVVPYHPNRKPEPPLRLIDSKACGVCRRGWHHRCTGRSNDTSTLGRCLCKSYLHEQVARRFVA